MSGKALEYGRNVLRAVEATRSSEWLNLTKLKKAPDMALPCWFILGWDKARFVSP